MSFPYTPTIPATNNDPADDQPLMQQNFASINSFVNVDHAGFASTQAGEHNQITFAANNVPSLPTATVAGNSQGILFSNTVGAGTVNQLFYYAGSAAQSSSQYVASANGSTFLLGGIIMKWGSTGVISGLGNVITFASAFPNNCFMVLLTLTDPNNPTVEYNVQSKTLTTFTCATSSNNKTFYYVAIGN